MGMLSRVVVVLGLVLTGAAVVPGAPSQAAGTRCTTEYRYASSPGMDIWPGQVVTIGLDTIGVPTTMRGQITDVDFAVQLRLGADQFEQHSADVLLEGPGQQMVLSGDLGRESRYVDLFLDDEASGPRPDGATYGSWRPSAPLSAFDGSFVPRRWTIRVRNTGQGTLTVTSARVVLDSNGCDPDHDGLMDLEDNCPDVFNRDQTDWDRDGLGNACDATPGTDPNAPAPTPVPTTPTTPPGTTPPGTTPPGTSPTTPPPATSVPGCAASCAYARTVGLDHAARKHRFRGKVESPAYGCRAGVDVTIWRKARRTDRKVVVVTSSRSGAYRTKAPRRPGRYYATVGSAGEALCGADRSGAVRVRRH